MRPLLLTFACVLFGCKTATVSGAQPGDPPEEVLEQYGSQLQKEDLVLGTGEEAVRGRTVDVHYTGYLTDGRRFDSTAGKEPFSFRLGAGKVIRGWDEGVVGMKVGGKRKLTVPPDLGYGERGMGGIPPRATLLFEIELVAVR